MPRKPTPTPAPVEDPLADLREEADAPVLPEPTEEPTEEEAPAFRVMVDQVTWDEMVAEAVAAWHQDPTSQGFLHGGGSVCGCAYIARQALTAAVPVAPLVETEEPELPSD